MFVPHPHTQRPGARLYRTGDLARYRPDGNIEFIERIDRQIKVRGFRVEVGEVEAALLRHKALKDVSVIAVAGERGDVGLFAYVVRAEEASRPPTNELRDFLRAQLPEYMIPRAFTFLDKLPLMANGKVDQRALPVPDKPRVEEMTAHVMPQNNVERMIAEIWQATLGLQRVGRHENFFDLGGHSLLMLQVHGQLCDRLKRDLPLVDLFTYPTVSALGAHLQQEGRQDVERSPAPARTGEGPDVKLNEGKQRLKRQLAQARQSSASGRMP
jgi:acyl carrier protein